MTREVMIFIDDSGQLHTNYHSDYFIYGGYWCFKHDVQHINSSFSRMIKNIYKTNKEVKTSEMTAKIKKNIVKRVFKQNNTSINPVFIATKVSYLTKLNFNDKQRVQLHKNYILRRLVEDVINDLKHKGINDVNQINIYIDNQSQTNLTSRDSFAIYINKCFTKNGYITHNYTNSNLKFNVKFLDSKSSKSIQLADLLANCKFHRYHSSTDEFNKVIEQSNKVLCRKHPKYFTCKLT